MSTYNDPAYLAKNSHGIGIYSHPFHRTDETLIASATAAEDAITYGESVSSAVHPYGITYGEPWDTDEYCIGDSRTATLDLNVDDDDVEVLIALASKRYGGAVSEQVQSILEGSNLFDQNPNALRYAVELFRSRNEHAIAEALDIFLELEDAHDHAGKWKTTLRKAEWAALGQAPPLQN